MGLQHLIHVWTVVVVRGADLQKEQTAADDVWVLDRDGAGVILGCCVGVILC